MEIEKKPEDELTIVFIDKNFKHQSSLKWDINGINRIKGYADKVLKLIWEKYLESGITGLCKMYPKNWKNYEQYFSAWEKKIKELKKRNEKQIKENKAMLSQKEIDKELPKFISTLKREDVGVIFSARNSKVWVKKAEDVDWKFFKKIIFNYEK